MRDVEFREWLGRRIYQGKALTTVGNRVGWVKAAERALSDLGFSEVSLDEVHGSGQWETLLQALSALRSDWRTNQAAAKAIAPQSADPHLQVANTRQAVGMYGRFLDGADPNYDEGEVDSEVDPANGAAEVRPFFLYDSEGHEYQPTRTFNRQTGASAFRLQRPGTTNRTDDAEEVDAIVDVARAMLIEGRLARVKRTDGTGPANYIGYGKTKLVRYRLDANLALQIGVPESSGSDVLSENTVEAVNDPNEGPFWFVGAAFGRKQDQFDRFIREGIWEIDAPQPWDQEKVLRMRPGQRIAIKSTYVRWYNLPFNNRDRAVSCMAIKAIGTIAETWVTARASAWIGKKVSNNGSGITTPISRRSGRFIRARKWRAA